MRGLQHYNTPEPSAINRKAPELPNPPDPPDPSDPPDPFDL